MREGVQEDGMAGRGINEEGGGAGRGRAWRDGGSE